MTAILTLSDLRNFDHKPSRSGVRTRYLCCFCHAEKPADDAHRCLDVDEAQGLFLCHRCGKRGRFGRETSTLDINQNARRNEEIRAHGLRQKAMWDKAVSNLVPLSGTAGVRYLEKRGIAEPLAVASGVLFSRCFLGRAGVVFPARDFHKKVCAYQARYTTDADPKTRTIGKAKYGVFATANAWDDEITICEAPIDALSLLALGIPAIACLGTSIPFWLPQAVEGRIVNLASDNDAAGECAAEVWRGVLVKARQIKRLKPVVVKDWNEELLRSKAL